MIHIQQDRSLHRLASGKGGGVELTVDRDGRRRKVTTELQRVE